MSWKVMQGKRTLKTYPHRQQAVIYCYEMGYVVQCRYMHFIVDGIRIVEAEGDEEETGQQGEVAYSAAYLPFAF